MATFVLEQKRGAKTLLCRRDQNQRSPELSLSNLEIAEGVGQGNGLRILEALLLGLDANLQAQPAGQPIAQLERVALAVELVVVEEEGLSFLLDKTPARRPEGIVAEVLNLDLALLDLRLRYFEQIELADGRRRAEKRGSGANDEDSSREA